MQVTATVSLPTVGSATSLFAEHKREDGTDRDISEITGETTETLASEVEGTETMGDTGASEATEATEVTEVTEVGPRPLYRGTNPDQGGTSPTARWDASQSVTLL